METVPKVGLSEGLIKCRIISFRLSDQEFGAVEEARKKHGFPSVSLFARSATLLCNSSEPVHSPIDIEINRLWRRLEVLTTALEAIASQFVLHPSV
jgi:hypothetical protein